MPGLSLREAAQQTGTSKSTILRAIQSGRLSAARLDDGGYSIDPAELFRVYEPKPPAPLQDAVADDGEDQDTPARAVADDAEMRIRTAELEQQIKALQDIVAMERERTAMVRERLEDEKRRADELRAERDRWAAQAERLALPAPTPSPTVAPALQPRGWWPWRRSA